MRTDAVLKGVDFVARVSRDPGDPHADLAAVREAGRGVAQDDGQLFLLRYDDCSTVLRDKRFVRTATAEVPVPGLQVYARNFLGLNPPDHTRLRGMIARAFTTSAVNTWRDRVQAVADELLDEIVAEGTVDLVSAYAQQIPVRVISEVVGVPAADAALFGTWAQTLVGALDNDHIGDLAVTGPLVVRAANEFMAYTREVFAAKRATPGNDVISMIIGAEESGQCDEPEALATAMLLLVAGHETTVELIGLGTLAAMENRDQWDRLVADPSLSRTAADEFLRYNGPLTLSTWEAAEDVELADGLHVEAGTAVSTVFTAANRDPRKFEDPDRLDISRFPNPHLGFSAGIHVCLGAGLARMEGEIAFATLARRCPGLQLAGDPVPRPSFFVRGLLSLPVSTR